MIAPTKPDGGDMRLREAYEIFYRTKSHRPRTIESYRESIAKWESYTSNPPINQTDNVMLFAFKQQMLEDFEPTTVNKHLRQILAMFNKFGPAHFRNRGGLGLIESPPWVELAEEDDKLPIIASDEEIDAIYQACETATWPFTPIMPVDWWRAVLVLLYNCGPRRNDWLSIETEHVDFKRGEIGIPQGKKRTPQWKPMHPVLVEHLRAIWEPCGRTYLFPLTREEISNTPRPTLYNQWYRIQKAAGLSEPFYWFHQIRKTCGTKLFEKSPGAAQEMLGHASVETTKKCYARMTRNVRDIAVSLEQPGAFIRDTPDDDPPDIIRGPWGAAG